VLIDGVRVGSATLGAAALNSYPIEAIERIEVLKGPFSGVYGADAAAGVIQLFTKKGGDGVGSVQASVGSDSLEEFDVSFNAGDARNSLHISAHSETTDGIDRTSILSGGNDDIDSFEETAFALGGKLSFGEFTSASINLLATDSTVDFDNTFGTDPGLQTESETFSSALSLNTQLSDSIDWNITLGSNKDQAETNGAFPSDLTTNRDTAGTELVFTLGGESVLTAGVDYYEEDIKSPTTTFPITNRDNKGAFAQFTTRAGAVGFAASLRYDDNSAYGTETNGSVAMSYQLSDNVDATVSYGTAFSAPSFNFLYFPFFGNPDLLPEESESFELRLNGRTGDLSWYVAAYKSDFKNLFSFNPNTFLAANVGEAEIEGIEASLSTAWAGWDLTVAADLLSATNKQTGIELDDRAEQTIALLASKNFGKLDLEFKAKSESGRYDRSGTELASYTLFDINASYRINDRLSLLAKVDNLFDKDHTVNLISATERYNTQGRQAKMSLRFNF
jgi:vitamin B12 transporter